MLTRLIDALEFTGTDGAQEIIDVATTQNGRTPRDILSKEEVMATMPILLRAVENKQLNGARVEKVVEMIRNA